MTDDGTQIADYRAVGTGRMTVELSGDGYGYTFRITGRTNTLTISDDEAADLAQMILEEARARTSRGPTNGVIIETTANLHMSQQAADMTAAIQPHTHVAAAACPKLPGHQRGGPE